MQKLFAVAALLVLTTAASSQTPNRTRPLDRPVVTVWVYTYDTVSGELLKVQAATGGFMGFYSPIESSQPQPAQGWRGAKVWMPGKGLYDGREVAGWLDPKVYPRVVQPKPHRPAPPTSPPVTVTVTQTQGGQSQSQKQVGGGPYGYNHPYVVGRYYTGWGYYWPRRRWMRHPYTDEYIQIYGP